MVYAFGDFELDTACYQLRRTGQPVSLEPKVFDLLTYLVGQRDRVVSRQELFQTLWPAEVVSDGALTYCIKAARRAIGDDGSAQRVIQTLHRRGYRFVAAVTVGTDGGGSAAPSPSPAPSPGFVGRKRELDQLHDGLEQALSGHGRLILLVGEAGIGKTRTADEVATIARTRDAEVLVGRCYEGDGAPAFWPWVQIVRAYIRTRDAAALERVMSAGAADIAQFVPELHECLPGLSTPPPLEPEQARFRLFDSTTRFLLAAAQRHPLVLILDDLHWADRPSLLLLQFLARELRDAHLLVIGTYRDAELGRQHPLAATLGELARIDHSQRIALQGFTRDDVAEFLAGGTGATPAEALVATVLNETDGNPFFVTEITRWLATTRTDGGGWKRGVPQTIREAIGRRLGQLSPACHEILCAASVIGREFDLTMLRHICAHRPGETADDGDALLRALDEAVGVRLVEPAGPPGRYRFVHALTRDTVYDALGGSERARLHGLAAHALEALQRGPMELHLALLAHHYLHAGPAEVDAALAYALRAAEHAASQLAYEAATAHYEHALQLLEVNGAYAERCDVLLALGETQWKAGDMTRARETFRLAAGIAREQRLVEPFARAALGFGDSFRGFEVGVVEPALLTLLDEALARLDGHSALRARVLARLAVALYHQPKSLARREQLSRQAVDIAQTLGDHAAHLATLYSRHWAIWGPDSLADRLEVAAEMIRLATQLGDQETAFHAHRFHFMDLMEAGAIESAEVDFAACAAFADELRQPYYHWYVETFRALRALLDGRFDDCERLSLAAAAVGQSAQNQNVSQIFGIQMFALRREQGRMAELEAPTRAFIAAYPTLPGWRAALAVICAETGDRAEARAQLDRLAADDFAALPRDTFWLAAIAGLADVCAFLGDAERAAVLFDLLRPYADRTVMLSPGAACSGSAARPLAQLAVTMGRWEAARTYFEVAIASEQRLGAVPLLAHTRRQYAAMLLNRPSRAEHGEARALLDDAAATYERLGMSGFLDRTRALLRAAERSSRSVVALSTRRMTARPLPRSGTSRR